MEKKKYELCITVLHRLESHGLLDRMILVGSWCVLLYREYFKDYVPLPVVRTRDIEFLIPIPPKFDRKVDLQALLRDLGFVIDFKGVEGYLVFKHPDMILEFLIPARGRDTNRPYPVPDLGINAQSLRFMDLLAEDTVQVFFGDVKVKIPHPANFALQKLLIARRRNDKDKADKDRTQAIGVLNALRTHSEIYKASAIYRRIPKTWQRIVRMELLGLGQSALLEVIEGGHGS